MLSAKTILVPVDWAFGNCGDGKPAAGEDDDGEAGGGEAVGAARFELDAGEGEEEEDEPPPPPHDDSFPHPDTAFDPRSWGLHVLDGCYAMEDLYRAAISGGGVQTPSFEATLRCSFDTAGAYQFWVESEREPRVPIRVVRADVRCDEGTMLHFVDRIMVPPPRTEAPPPWLGGTGFTNPEREMLRAQAHDAIRVVRAQQQLQGRM